MEDGSSLGDQRATGRHMRPCVIVFVLSSLAGPAAAQSVTLPDDLKDDVVMEILARAKILRAQKEETAACELAREALAHKPGAEIAKQAEQFASGCDGEVAASEVMLPVDPYADDKAPPAQGTPPGSGPRLQLMIFGAAYGGWSGFAVARGADIDSGSSVLISFLPAAVFGLTTYLVAKDRQISEGDALAIMSVPTWATVQSLFLTHAISDVGDQNSLSDRTYYNVAFWSGMVGLGAGLGVAFWAEPDVRAVAFTNSLIGYGSSLGLVLGGLFQPARDGAYSMNAIIGGSAGALAGILLGSDFKISRKRLAMMDLGVGLGAIPGLIGLAVADGGGQQAISLLSLGLMGGGAYLGWRLGKKYDGELATSLAYRDKSGGWHIGIPALRTNMSRETPVVTLDLFGGQF